MILVRPMFSEIIFDDKALLEKLKEARQVITNPKKLMLRIHQNVLKPGFEKQFRTEGRHWSGGEWEERGPQTKRIREEQGEKPDTTLIFTGRTMRDWIPVSVGMDYAEGMLVGSPHRHVVDIQEGQPGPITVAYNVGGENVKIYYKQGIPARQLQPLNGLNSDEITNITNIVSEEIEKALSK